MDGRSYIRLAGSENDAKRDDDGGGGGGERRRGKSFGGQ